MLWHSPMRNSHIEKTNPLFCSEFQWFILQGISIKLVKLVSKVLLVCTYRKHLEMPKPKAPH